MIVYIKEANGNITNISTEVIEDSTPIEIECLSETLFMPGYDKKLVNGKLVDIPNEIEQQKILQDNMREVKLRQIKNLVIVITSGKVFDGDEKSQERMLRAINIASITGQTETQWKLADNTIVMVTLDELKEALALAGQEMSRIWLEN